MNRYLEIFADLEQKILEGIYLKDSLLPSENQLAANYSVSRETIRKALVLLLESGYIQKKQGKGSIVLDVKKFVFPISGLTSYKELQISQNISSNTIVHKLEELVIDKKMSQSTHLPVGTKTWELIRLREINGEVVILDKDYLLVEIIPELPITAAEDSVYEYLENQLKLDISYAQKEIVVENSTEEDRELMLLQPTDTHVVVVRSNVYLEDTRLFQFTESRHRIDKFRFVEFARRRKV